MATDEPPSLSQRAHYSPPWANTSIIGIAGSSGSGKTSLALAIIASLNLPWVVILSMDSYYKPLTPAQSRLAFANEFDFDSPDAIDFDILVCNLRAIQAGKKAEVPVYSFEKHARLPKTTSIYSPHVLILEGIFALHDPRVLSMLDLKVFAEADADLCLSRRLLRDVQSRGRDVSGCIKQWFKFVKPNFRKYVEPQRDLADIIVPRGIENKVAIDMITSLIRRTLLQKSHLHTSHLASLSRLTRPHPLPDSISTLPRTPQTRALTHTLTLPTTSRETFIHTFDRLATLLIEQALTYAPFVPHTVTTPTGHSYAGLTEEGEVSTVLLLRGGSCLDTALRRSLPDCREGRLLIQTDHRTGEPALHFRALPKDIASHSLVLLLDAQMSSGGAALMAVRVLVDHGVAEERIVLVAFEAGRDGVARLVGVFPGVRVVVARLGGGEGRWVEGRYLGC
ncbi:uridine kinase [Trichodelitschia bisporula]|uniref:uridine/cytidine kinase n=1 Tax=Trichodelitschia bisporula TaxID=703511 RepID=A0A6G1HKZ6_9PEZI|nr:uridine kinase [Trichodelitschia bisporula]